ncbi:MAG: hypothetical protein Tsb0014_11470 [Pleurocapsa sp.]
MFKSLSKMIILASISLAIVLFSCQVSKSFYQSPPLVWTTSAMTSVGISDLAPATAWQGDRPATVEPIHLMAARGEYEAFQIVIQASVDDLNQVDVEVSNLSSRDGRHGGFIEAKNITLYREHYMYIDRPSPSGWSKNPTRGVDWYADGLIPFVDPETGQDLTGAAIDAVPFNLETGKNQPIWVDIFVPRNLYPGEYYGKFTVKSDRGSTTGEILLTVWDFELPVKPSMNSLFDVWEDRGPNTAKELVKHKVMPGVLRGKDNKAELINQWGLNSVRLPFWSGANYSTCQMNLPPTVEELKNASSPYPSDLLVYVFSADEIDECQNLEPLLRQWGKNIHEAGLKHLVVMTPKRDLYDAIDIWVVQPQMYLDAGQKIAEVKQQGDEIWFYTGHLTEYSPQWHVDSQPINWRIAQGFIAQSLGITGVLHWRAEEWTNDPWRTVFIYQEGKNDFPGDGMVIYPGKEVGIAGVVPSIRLKWLREGIEDYEYIEMLKKQGFAEWALQLTRSVGADWRNWTQDPEKLEAVRREMGNKIEQLNI